MKIPLFWLADYVQTDKSPREIGDSFTRIGLMLDKPIGDDGILDLEQRLNRSDLLSILGCARDFAVFENLKLHEPKVKLHKPHELPAGQGITIKVETPAVRRFTTRLIKGIKIGPSPAWLKERLEAYGIDSINNIVDVTNFVMLELGQPMHAQDIDSLPQPEITIRDAKKGETLTTLLGTTVRLEPPAFVLTSGGIPQVIGGIVGGANSGVTGTTVNILLDAGNYDPRIVRKASRRLKITNETVTHCDKPLDPRLTEIALNRATDLILELAGGTYYVNDDYYPDPVVPQTLDLTLNRLQKISGQDITLKEAKYILKALGYAITQESKKGITVEVPYFRTDVEVEDDLVSDVLRMRDYNNIPSASLHTPIPADITPGIYLFEEKLRDYMIALGGHEHITTQLVLDDGNPDRVVLENALSADQNALRMSATETLPYVLNNYRKHGIQNPVIFEIGKSFLKKRYQEIRELVIIDPSDIRATLATLMKSLNIQDYSLSKQGNYVDIKIKKTLLGSLQKDFCVLYTPALMEHASPYPKIISDFGRTTALDISLTYSSELNFSDITLALKHIEPRFTAIEVVDEYGKWKLVRLTWDKSITDIDGLRKKIIDALAAIKVETRSG